MRLLFDQNLAPRLSIDLADLYPDSAHVRHVGLERANDDLVWRYAKAGGFAIVTKDDDFRQLSFVFGPPPKVIWLRLGNCSTATVEATLRGRQSDVVAFGADATAALLLLSKIRQP